MWQVPNSLRQADPEVAQSMERESRRQQDHIELIASENFVSEAVLAAMGSVLTNKYAEGYPAHRYYGGCEYVDEVERLAINRAKELFGAERMARALNENADAAPVEILRGMRGAVDAFVRDAEQFDDLTMLCLEYKGGEAQ